MFFQFLCFGWAATGIISRIAMALMGEKWAQWEQSSAYKNKRPLWVVIIAILGLGLVVATWTVYFIQGIRLGWILGILVSLTTIKVTTLLFRYEAFLVFLKTMLASKKKMLGLNISVLILSTALIAMGIFLY